jgi:hypothetical protein
MFRAIFLTGPLEGKYIDMAAPRTPERLFFAPAPGDIPEHFVTANGYLAVGHDDPPYPPWPGQIEYRLDRDQSRLRPHGLGFGGGMEEGQAVYVVAGDDL